MEDEKKETKKNGGRRPGAGRKPDAVPKSYVQVRLTDEERAILKALGGSKWLQQILRANAAVLRSNAS